MISNSFTAEIEYDGWKICLTGTLNCVESRALPASEWCCIDTRVDFSYNFVNCRLDNEYVHR